MLQAFERRGEGDFWRALVAAPDLKIRGGGGGGGGGGGWGVERSSRP